MIAALILVIVVFLALYLRLWKTHRQTLHKVQFLFTAIDNGDYTFRFSEKSGNDGEKLLNASLNRVKQILQHARDEQIQREKYYELILNQIDTGILVVDEERGVVLQHNKASERLLNRDAITHISQVQDKLGGFSVHEVYSQLKERRVRIIGFSDIQGELAKRETESWIKLIRVLTHEVMNTLTPIISISETLINNAKGEQQEGLQVIHQTSKELTDFVESYRKFTHLPKPAPSIFYIKPFLERMARLTPRHVSLEVEPRDLILYADEGLVARVVTNLIKNATQATAEDGDIWLKAYTDATERVFIDVSNNGPLIPDDVAAHIFVPFFTTKQEGSGIGLSISRQIMGLSNGTIDLVSDKDRLITTFRLTFN